MQLDALREVANIGCGHAVNALSRLMGGRKVSLSIPRVLLTGTSEVTGLFGGGATEVLAARLGIEGQLQGLMLLVLPVADASTLEHLLLGSASASPEERESAISEAANIVASACLSAIGTLTRWRLLPTVPVLMRGPVGEVLASAAPAEGTAQQVVVLETHFLVAGAPELSGQMLLVLERSGSQALLARLGL
jgi:chemotaxis protein CheC